MKRNYSEIFGKSLLAIFLFATHAKLFYWLDPDFTLGDMVYFSYLRLTEKTIQAMVFGLLFGLMTVFVLQNRRESILFKGFVISIAILDGLAVNYLYNENFLTYWKIGFASTHYTLYTIFIILMYGFASRNEKKANAKNNANAQNAKGKNDAKVLQMQKDGKEHQEIAEALNINLSTVYRIIKKYENE